jgi:hypothetical protein
MSNDYTPVKQAAGADAAAKFWIKSLDKGENIVVSAQFNPKELQIDRSVPWSPPGEAGKEQSKNKTKGGVDLEFTGAKGRTLTVELLFDAYEADAKDGFKLEDLETRIANLEKLAAVRKPGSKLEDERRPHWCLAVWGTALTKFQCVIESISTKYTMFSRDGKPLRATVTLKLTEADSVSTKKEGKK